MLKETAPRSQTSMNVLNSVEDVLFLQNWSYQRISEEELVVGVSGKFCQYRVFFIWSEEMQALQFCCQYDIIVLNNHREQAAQALSAINENLWMGHFDIPHVNGTPTFRHTCLMRGLGRSHVNEAIEDLIDIGMTQCERYYPVFHLLAAPQAPDDDSLSFALMDIQGHS